MRRLDNVIASGDWVVVGDANGADKAVQRHFREKQYRNITVYCSGDIPRNNLGSWQMRNVDVPKDARGFQFYAAKDREMAREADFGLMIWDGKSPGTVLNVLRLVVSGKAAVLFNVPNKEAVTIRTVSAWQDVMSNCSRELQISVKERATLEERKQIEYTDEPNFLAVLGENASAQSVVANLVDLDASPGCDMPDIHESLIILNQGLALGDPKATMKALGVVARKRGMSNVAVDSGLARESLYRSLAVNGNPEFATVLKVLSAMRLRLVVTADLAP